MRRSFLLAPLLALSACASSSKAVPSAPVAPADDNPALAVWRFLSARYDRDGDARITPAEYGRSPQGFRRLDADRDGRVTAVDFDPQWDGQPRLEQGESFVYGEGGPELGDPAPDFRLRTTGGDTLELASFRGRPVVLVFGSFT